MGCDGAAATPGHEAGELVHSNTKDRHRHVQRLGRVGRVGEWKCEWVVRAVVTRRPTPVAGHQSNIERDIPE